MKSFRFLICLTVAICAVSMAQASAKTSAGGFRISGTVVDRLSGAPLAGTIVTVSAVTARQDIQSVQTGANGHFAFQGLAKGKYSLSASRRGYTLQAFEQHQQYSSAIAVGPGLESENLVFRLRPDASIHGVITDEQGEPAANVSVRLFGQDVMEGTNSIHSVRQANTDDRGEYYLSHLGEGTYYLAVSGRPWYSTTGMGMPGMEKDPEVAERIAQESRKVDLVYPLTFYSGATSADDATAIHLHPGESFQADMSLQAVPAVHIRFSGSPSTEEVQLPTGGTVVSGRGGMRGFRQYIAPRVEFFTNVFGVWENSGGYGISSNSEGQYQIGGIAPGHYLVEMTTPGTQAATSQEMDLTGDIELTPGSGNAQVRVTGAILVDGVVPEGMTFVQLRSQTGQRSYGAPVNKGQFEINEAIMPGRYEVMVGTRTGVVYVSAMSATGGKIVGQSVLSTTDKNVQLSIVASRGVAEVNGVANEDGKPKAGVMVVLVPLENQGEVSLMRRDQSDSDGTFTLRQISPGKYKLVAIEDGWTLEWANPKALAPFLKDAPVYELQSNQKAQVRVEVQKSGK